MTTDLFQSSDSVRTSRPLQHASTCTFKDSLKLELGGVLQEITVTPRNLRQFECSEG